jgi:hypothetical protein
LKNLIAAEQYDWANWFIVRIMQKEDYIRYGLYGANIVLHIYEEKYPDDKRPREAISAARKYLNGHASKAKARAAADAAADAATAAAARAAYAATAAAAWAAYAAYAAADAANAAHATAEAALAATDAADAATAAAADAAQKEMPKRILKYGLRLLRTQ